MKLVLTIALAFTVLFSNAQVVPVQVEQVDGKWTLLRGGEPYYIYGGGGKTHLDELIAVGGNSIRTWGLDEADEALEAAHEKGLTVMLGLWVQHERHGFDYNDPIAVAKQLEGFRAAVKKYKDHPALLMWGVGNEVDLFYTNTKVWDAVQDIAAMIHELDPHHPTSTVTAGLDEAEVKLILEKAPDIDIYGVNTYGDIAKVPANIRSYGWDGPYMITEWGVNGHWESPMTEFGVPIEQTSTEKAQSFDERYSLIENDSLYCIGSYAFLWGNKQETTSTWYGLFTPDGQSSAVLDVLSKRWNGTLKGHAPKIESILIDGLKANDNIFLIEGDVARAETMVVDPDGDAIRYSWSIIPESTDKKAGGDAESAPDAVPGSAKAGKKGEYSFRVPKTEGPYRLFLFASDGNERVATANVPFYVLPRPEDAGQARGVEFKPMTLDIPGRD